MTKITAHRHRPTLDSPQRAAITVSAVALAAATVRLFLPQPPESPMALVPQWVAVVAAALGLLAARAASGRLIPPRAVVVGASGAAAGLVVVAADGIAFDVLGLLIWAIGAVTGAAAPMALWMDWPGLATRVIALVAGALVAGTAVRYRRRVRGDCDRCGHAGRAHRWASAARWTAYPAAVLALGYGALKAAWGLGSHVGMVDPGLLGEVSFWTPGLGDTVVLAAIGVALALVLAGAPRERSERPVSGWGRRLRRSLPLAGAVLGAAMLIPVGLMGSYGIFTGASAAFDGRLAPWVTYGIYPWFLAWGLTLGSAAWSYRYRTRRQCTLCGQGPPSPS